MSKKNGVPKDPDLANIEKALRRAGKAARELAGKTHTPCYVLKGGKIVDIAEGQTDYQHEEKPR